MDKSELIDALSFGEERDLEFKSAKGGVPSSLWETYSAMANTDGGCIVLGVEHDGKVSGLPDVAKAKKSFWDTINNRGKVSANLLTDQDVTEIAVEGKVVLAIRVPRAARRQKPIYVGQNPIVATYRRNYEGDYHCSADEVGRMLADQAEEPADSRILTDFGFDDLDKRSLDQYRQRFSARDPQHPWLSKKAKSFLEKLGGWRKDRATGQEGLTIAGLLMFGHDEAIRDAAALPQFQLDYRECLSDDPAIRWTDRLTIDGTWTANLFQFYQKVIVRLAAELKIPFQLKPDLFRKDDTIVHEAIREAFVNALIHADYRGQGGIVIEKHRNRMEISNPGTLLISFDQILRGGVSECRNKSLQTMFLLIGGGERAGSGIDKIRQGWRSQHWRWPSVQERMQPDRVRLVLPMVSLLPDESVARMRKQFGAKFDLLDPLEVQALVTADLELEVTNQRLREMSDEHPANITKSLQKLCSTGFLVKDGQGRWSSYRLAEPKQSVTSPPRSQAKNSSHTGDSSHKGVVDWSHKLEVMPEEELTKLRVIATPALRTTRLPTVDTRTIILTLCDRRFLTAADLGELMNRNSKGLRDRFLTPLVAEGLLVRKFPNEPNRPDQAYTRK